MDNLKETEEEKQKRIKAWKLRQKRYWFNRITEEKGIGNVIPEVQVSLLPFTPEQEQLETLLLIKEQGKDFFYDINMCTEFPTKTELEEIEERRENQRVVNYYKQLGFKGVKIKDKASKNMSESGKKYWESLTEKQREARKKKIGKGIKKSRKKNNWKSNKGEKRSHKYDY